MAKQPLNLSQSAQKTNAAVGDTSFDLDEAEQNVCFADICQQAAIGVAYLNAEGKWLWANAKLCEILGYTPEELYQLTFMNITHPEDLPHNLLLEQRVLTGEIATYALEKRYITKAKKVIWVKVTTSLINNAQNQRSYRVAFIEDITEKKQVEKELRRLYNSLEDKINQRTLELRSANQALQAQIAERQETERVLRETSERLHLALASARMGTWYWSNTDNKVIWDEHIERLFGLQPGSFKGSYEDFLACVHPDDRERVRSEVGTTLSLNTETQSEYRIILPDGSIRVIAARGKIFCDAAGKPVRTTGVCLDVTAHKEVEQSLHNLTERYNLALESAQAGTWYRTLPDNVTLWDEHIQRLFGYEPGTFPGTYEAFLNRIHPEDREHTIHKIENFTRERKVFELEYRVIWPDGSIHYIADRGQILSAQPEQTIRLAGVCLDITERKEVEEWVRQRQQDLANAARIHSLGEMASTLAHELNQPLAAIVNYTKGCIYRIKDKHFEADQILEALEQTAQQAERAGEIIHRMKNFVQKGRLYFEKVELNEILRAVIGFFDYKIRGYDVSIEFQLTEEIPSIEIDKMQIEQVLLNLIRNAVEAMQEAATIKPKITITSRLKQHYITIQIIDNGPGFTAELADRLWEPYFTTKKQGIGIGLSMCRTIIEEHGGQLTAVNNPEGGACFEMSLPLQRKHIF